MPGFENKIWGTVYDEPYSETCYKRVCVPGLGCRDVPYPCVGMHRYDYSIYFGVNYPHVDPVQEAIIFDCAVEGGIVAAGIISAAWAACTLAPYLCIPAIVVALYEANEQARARFYYCLKQRGLPEDIIAQCNYSIYDRKTRLFHYSYNQCHSYYMNYPSHFC